MPTYRYRRPDGTSFEVLQKFSDAPLAEDPETGVPVERVISGGAGLQFKGTGFYKTDYVDAPAAKKATASGGSTSGSTSSDSPPSKVSTASNDD